MSKTMKETYDSYINKWQEIRQTSVGSLFDQQENRYVSPFQIYGNLYYVGDNWCCVHLIDTGEGLLLIDCGNCGATAMLVHSIWEAGFNPADVKWIILSHGHVDHIGGALFFRRMFGSKIYMGAPDCAMFREHPERVYLQDGSDCSNGVFDADVEIHDGDALRFGGMTVDCTLVPGHTPGCVALFFDVTNGEEVKRAGYYGGFGFNTLTADYLREIGDNTLQMREIYLQSLQKVRDRQVDIFLGNHTNNNQTMVRRQKMLDCPKEENPFIDSSQWSTYLDQMRDDFLAFQKENF